MGQYLIPNARSSKEAALFVPFGPGRRWENREDGVLFVDPNLTDSQCQSLYATFVPSGQIDEQYQIPVPDEVRLHLQHLRDYVAASPASITNAQTVHVLQDLIRAIWHLNKRFQDEG